MANKYCSVAIDGPSGAGKSTIARRVAEGLGFLYVDTGAIYRTVGLAACRAGLAFGDVAGVTALLETLELKLTYENGVQKMLLHGEDVSEEIRRPQIAMYASDVSAMPPVRAYLLELQRSLARTQNVIMDGRDIGTVVLPDAGLKIFLTASAEERAMRRFHQLQAKGDPTSYEEILQQVNQRDHNDMTRAAAPLKQAEDAVLVDTTGNTLEQSVAIITKIVQERFGL